MSKLYHQCLSPRAQDVNPTGRSGLDQSRTRLSFALGPAFIEDRKAKSPMLSHRAFNL
jgi:hypothetical protein